MDLSREASQASGHPGYIVFKENMFYNFGDDKHAIGVYFQNNFDTDVGAENDFLKSQQFPKNITSS